MTKKIILIFNIIFMGIAQTNAQTSAYHSIVFPYDVSNNHAMSFGGIISADPDPISGIHLNSAGLAFYDKPVFSSNYLMNTKIYDFNYDYFDDRNVNTGLNTNPGFLSVMLPIIISGKKMVISSAIQGVESPEIEIWDEIYLDQQIGVEHSRKGAVSKTDIAISSQLVTDFGIGIGISKWSGTWTWHDQVGIETIGYGTFRYTGSSISLALLYKWSKINLGLTLYSPFQLMTSSVTTNYLYFRQIQNQRDMEQKFDGAARLSLKYSLKPDLYLGIDYRWQDKISIKNKILDSLNSSFTDSYSKSHQIAIVIGKDFKWHFLKLPLFTAYTMNIKPTTTDNFPGGYQKIKVSDEDKIQHSIHSGVNLLYNSYGFYLSVHWEMGSVQVYDLSNIDPLS